MLLGCLGEVESDDAGGDETHAEVVPQAVLLLGEQNSKQHHRDHLEKQNTVHDARRRVFFSGRYRWPRWQCRTDFCVPKYARDSFNLTTSVESGFLVDGPSGASTEEGLALAGVGCGRGWVMVTLV